MDSGVCTRGGGRDVGRWVEVCAVKHTQSQPATVTATAATRVWRERMVVRASPNQHPSTRGHTHASQQEVIDEWVLDGGGSVVRRPPTRREHTEERVGDGMNHRTTHPPRERERHMHRIPEVHTPRENSRGVSDCGRKPHEDRGDVVWIVWGGWCEWVCG